MMVLPKRLLYALLTICATSAWSDVNSGGSSDEPILSTDKSDLYFESVIGEPSPPSIALQETVSDSVSISSNVPAARKFKPSLDSDTCLELRSRYNNGDQQVRRRLSKCYRATWRQLFESLSPNDFLRETLGDSKPDSDKILEFFDEYALLVPWDAQGQPDPYDPHVLRIMQYNMEQPADILKLRQFLTEEQRYFGSAHPSRPGRGRDFERLFKTLVIAGHAAQRMQYLLVEWYGDFEDPETGEIAFMDAWTCLDPQLNCWDFSAYSSRVLQYAGIPAQRLQHQGHAWTAIRFRHANLHIDLESHQKTGLGLLAVTSQNVLQAATLDPADEWRQGFGYFPALAEYFTKRGLFFDGERCVQLHDDEERRLLPLDVPNSRPAQICAREELGEITYWNPREWNLLETNALMEEGPDGGDYQVRVMLPEILAAKLKSHPQCADTPAKRAVMRYWFEEYFGAMDELEVFLGRPESEPSRVSEALYYSGLDEEL